MKIVLRLLLLPWLLAACVVDGGDDGAAEAADVVGVGDRLPAFTVEVVEGDARTLFYSTRLQGPTVIVFFNTGCADCQRELPRLNDYYLLHRSDPGFRMVAIAREESEESIAAYWVAHGLSIPYSPQPDRRVYSLFATATIPRAYRCSAEGVITWMGVEHFDIAETE